jgi:hypothetical protein
MRYGPVFRMRSSAKLLWSGAPLIRDRHAYTTHIALGGSGSAAHHFVLRRARDTRSRSTALQERTAP